jgi:hypothetical protein
LKIGEFLAHQLFGPSQVSFVETYFVLQELGLGGQYDDLL